MGNVVGLMKDGKNKEWEWSRKEAEHYQCHQDRYPLLRPVRYEATAQLAQEGVTPAVPGPGGTALSINVSSGGMCLLMEMEPAVREVLRVHVPMPVTLAETPTLAEVRWVRRPPFAQEGVYVVGLKFIL